MRHVLVMTAASATGLLTMFGVDMVDMYFLTLLGEQELAAAVGFAGTLMFFLVAISIGLQISLGALVARSEGAQRRDLASRYCSSGLLFSVLFSVVISFFGCSCRSLCSLQLVATRHGSRQRVAPIFVIRSQKATFLPVPARRLRKLVWLHGIWPTPSFGPVADCRNNPAC